MVTQKDVHNNIVVNASVWQKRYLSLTCDRCGKEIKVGLLCTNSITRNGILNMTYDLCNECMEDFERFMRNDR